MTPQIVTLDERKIAGMAGAPADCVMFSEYVSKNMALYAINNDMSLSTHATANYIRGEVSARHAHACVRGRAIPNERR